MVGIIDYGAGNTRSVINALKTIGADFVLTSDQTILRQADQIILPGVGHAGKAMERLSSAGLIDFILNCELPFLGICLGMQLMTSYSEEGNTPCLGLLDVSTDVFDGQKVGKVPHMGWNRMQMDRGNPLFEGIPEGSYMYFVHSYFVGDCVYTIARTTYTDTFSAAVQYRNFFGVQFHPEKSGESGSRMLLNFINF
jgi:imidazole glycerol-phosphate synthase subunit HisH